MSERTTGGQPAVSEEVHEEAMDVAQRTPLYSMLTRHVTWTHKHPYQNHIFCQVVFHNLNLSFGA